MYEKFTKYLDHQIKFQAARSIIVDKICKARNLIIDKIYKAKQTLI